MKKKFLALLSLVYAVSHTALFGVIDQNKTKPIRFVTYNIRRSGDENDPQNLWANRKGLVFDMINTLSPDVIGFQEVVQDQFDDLKTVLADYDSFGERRSTYMKGWIQNKVMNWAKDEHSPIFYNTKKMRLIGAGNFGINPGGTLLPRICTWGLFEDRDSGKQFYVYNTHLTNTEKGFRRLIAAPSGRARRRQVSMIRKHIKAHTNGLPVVLMGDFNTPLTGKRNPRRLEKAGLVNAKALANTVVGPQETRTGWNNSELKKIDHIFIKANNPIVEKYEVVASPDGVFPSDHRPVIADVKL